MNGSRRAAQEGSECTSRSLRLHLHMRLHSSSSHRWGAAPLSKILELYKQYGIRRGNYVDFKVRIPSVPSVGIHSLVRQACAYSVQAHHHKTHLHVVSLPTEKCHKFLSGYPREKPCRVLLLHTPCSLSLQLSLAGTPSELHHDPTAPFWVHHQVPAHQRVQHFLISRRIDMNFMYFF